MCKTPVGCGCAFDYLRGFWKTLFFLSWFGSVPVFDVQKVLEYL